MKKKPKTPEGQAFLDFPLIRKAKEQKQLGVPESVAYAIVRRDPWFSKFSDDDLKTTVADVYRTG